MRALSRKLLLRYLVNERPYGQRLRLIVVVHMIILPARCYHVSTFTHEDGTIHWSELLTDASSLSRALNVSPQPRPLWRRLGHFGERDGTSKHMDSQQTRVEEHVRQHYHHHTSAVTVEISVPRETRTADRQAARYFTSCLICHRFLSRFRGPEHPQHLPSTRVSRDVFQCVLHDVSAHHD